MRTILSAFLLLLGAVSAQAQSGCVNLAFGTVLTPAQWQQCFQGKQDVLTSAPLPLAGGTMNGQIVTAPSTTANSGFRIPPGVAPTSPINGDFWTTASGVFARINGTTINLGSGGGGGALLASNNLSDLASVPTARTNLGLGGAALLNIGTTVGTAMAGNDSRVTSLTPYANLPVTTPESCGGGAGVADNTSAFQCMATFCNSAGSCRVELTPNVTYTVVPTNLTGGSVTLFSVSNINAMVWNSNGAKITTPNNFTGSHLPSPGSSCPAFAYILGILVSSTSYNITINDLWTDQSGYASPDPCNGIQAITLINTVQNVRVNNLKMTGAGNMGFDVQRNTTLATRLRSRGIFLNNAALTNVFYGVALEKNGDQFVGRGVRVYSPSSGGLIGTGRPFVIYNVHNVDLDIYTELNTSYGSILQVYPVNTESVYENTLQSVKLKYTWRPNTAQSGGNPITLQLNQSGVPGGTAWFRDIDVNFDVDLLGVSSTSTLFTTGNNYGSNSAEFQNIKFSGTVLNYPAQPILRLFSDQNWTGAAIHGITVENMYINCTATCPTTYDGRGTTGTITFKNVEGNANATFAMTNTVLGTVDVSQGVNFSNFKSYSASPSQTAWFRYLPGGYLQQGGTVTAAAGPSNTAVTLPIAMAEAESFNLICTSFGEQSFWNGTASGTTLNINRPQASASSCPIVWEVLGRF